MSSDTPREQPRQGSGALSVLNDGEAGKKGRKSDHRWVEGKGALKEKKKKGKKRGKASLLSIP